MLAETDQQEPIFRLGVIRVVEQQRIIVEERRLRLRETDSVLSLIRGIFPRVPSELRVSMPKSTHTVHTAQTARTEQSPQITGALSVVALRSLLPLATFPS